MGAQLCSGSKGLHQKGGLFHFWFPREKGSSGRVSWPCSLQRLTPHSLQRDLNLALQDLVPESPSPSSSISHLLLKHRFPVVAESEAPCLLTSQKHFLSLSVVWGKHAFLLWPLRDCQMLGDWVIFCYFVSSSQSAQHKAWLP